VLTPAPHAQAAPTLAQTTEAGRAVDAAGGAAAKAVDGATALVGADPYLWISVILAALVLLGLFIGDVIRPGSPRRAGLRDTSPHPAFIWGACVFLVYAAQQVGGAIVAEFVLAGAARGVAALTLRQQALLALSGYLAGLAAAFIVVRLLRISAPNSGLAARPRDVGAGVLCFLLALPVVNAAAAGALALYQRLAGPVESAIAHDTLQKLVDNRSDPWAWALAAAAVIAAPIVEEVLYRGLLQSALLRLTGRPWVAVFASSAIFALMHRLGAPVPWYAVATIFVLGVAMGLAFERTKSLAVPITMHVLFNAMNVAMAVL